MWEVGCAGGGVAKEDCRVVTTSDLIEIEGVVVGKTG